MGTFTTSNVRVHNAKRKRCFVVATLRYVLPRRYIFGTLQTSFLVKLNEMKQVILVVMKGVVVSPSL